MCKLKLTYSSQKELRDENVKISNSGFKVNDPASRCLIAQNNSEITYPVSSASLLPFSAGELVGDEPPHLHQQN
jgi:hypothetical protein